MSRAIASLVGIALLAAVIAVGVFGYRLWARRSASASPSVSAPSTPVTRNSADNSAASATPRRPVTIDPRRQQLIGVHIVPVVRSSLAETIRAAGTIRYDETRQVDVNVRVDGWIRDLYVDSTAQMV